MNNLLQTYTNKIIDVVNPTIDMVDIIDIARGLAYTCRYAGQCPHYYSVAEHSIHCCIMAQKLHLSSNSIKWALLHDAAEAYIGDIARPIKSIVPEFKKVEDHLLEVIALKFNLKTYKIPTEVIEIDNRMLTTEAYNMGMSLHLSEFWHKGKPKYHEYTINYYDHDVAEITFLEMAHKIGIR